MNHFKTGNAYFAQGSYKSNKYNSKELQETGMYSYGWREYMPDIAKWNGIDQLAESYMSASPYAYVANNPVNFFDPDGRVTMSAFTAAIWDATPGGTNSYWYNNGSGFTSYDGGGKGAGGGSGLAYNSTVTYGGAFTMGDWTYAIPPVIINGKGNASNWNKGDNYFPNIFAMGMAFNQSLASWNYRNGGTMDPMAWVRNDGPIRYMGGAGDPFGIWEGIGLALSSSDSQNMNLAAIPLLVMTRNGDDALKLLAAEKGMLKAEAKAISKEAVATNGTLTAGPFAGEGLIAKNGKSRNFTAEERRIINEQGYTNGCHTCGQTSPGTKSGNFILDHQPANALIPAGWPQTFYPHCKYCSSSQGGIIGGMKKQGILPKISE